MDKKLLKSCVVALALIGGGNVSAWAQNPDLTKYTIIKTMDFSKTTYPKDVEMTLSTTQCGTAWETGNKLQQKIFEVATPEDLKGYLALQGVKGSKNGWWLRSTQGGLYSYGASRSGAVLNLKKDYIVAFNCTQDAAKVITLNNSDGNPDGPFTYEKSENTKTYYATLTADGQVGFCGNKTVGYISSIVIYAPGTVVIQPTASYTAVNGKSRTVTFSGVNLAYNTDGSDTYTLFKDGAGNNVNKAEVTVDQPTTYYVVSTDGDKKSDVLEFRIEAGEELALATPVASISKMGEGFTRTYSVTCDNKDVLLTPKAKFTYDFTPADGGEKEIGIESKGTIEATTAGTYVVTASAEGYLPTTVSIDNTKAYKLTKTYDFTKLNAEDLSANWKKKAEGGKLPGSASQWQNKYGDVTADEYFYDFSSETASATDIIDGLNVEFNKDGKAPKLYTGFGFMYPIYQMNAEGDDNTDNKVAINSGNISIADGTADQVGVYTYINNYGKNGTKTSVVAGDKAFALYRFSDMLTKIDIYSPVAEDITKDFTATGYTSFSAAYDVAVPAGVAVYKAKAEADAVVLTCVNTDVIPANTGVILYCAEGGEQTFSPSADEADLSDALSDNELIATSVKANATVPTEDTYYALSASKAEFCPLKGGITLSGNKAYLKGVTANEAKTMRIIFAGGETTGINVPAKADTAAKAYYTLQGVKVQQPVKGINIVDGKKIIVK